MTPSAAAAALAAFVQRAQALSSARPPPPPPPSLPPLWEWLRSSQLHLHQLCDALPPSRIHSAIEQLLNTSSSTSSSSSSAAAAFLLEALGRARAARGGRDGDDDDVRFVEHAARVLVSDDEALFALGKDKIVALARVFRSERFGRVCCASLLDALKTAIERLRGSNPHVLTPLHPVFALLCLRWMALGDALDVIEAPVFEVDSGLGLTDRDNLEYHFYAGVIFASLERFQRSRAALRNAVGAPSKAVSAIQVAAYKKLVLVELIVSCGASSPLPKFTSAIVAKTVERLAPTYSILSTIDRSDPIGTLRRRVEAHWDELRNDSNGGLARRAIEALVKRSIVELNGVYRSVPLTIVAQTAQIASVEETEAFVVRMIVDGELDARIDPDCSMLLFNEESSCVSSEQVDALESLAERLERGIELFERAQHASRALTADARFIRAVRRAKPARDSAAAVNLHA